MRRRAIYAGLIAFVVLGSLAIGGSSAAARPGDVAMCFVPRGAPHSEHDVQVSPSAAERLLRKSLSYRGVCASYGESAAYGNGRVKAFTQSRGRVPSVVGVAFRRTTLDGLPYHPPTAGNWCYDVNGDGMVHDHAECVGGYDRALHFSKEFRRTVNTPYEYALFNWNPMGHIPSDLIYNKPHFDVHFYVTPNSQRLAIRAGPCAIVVNCDDYKIGKVPVDPKYVAPDYYDVDAVEAAMGNHLLDITAPEIFGQPFTHTFIYGAYNGRITFYEPMVTHAWFSGLADGTIADSCFAMKLPQAWQRSGWYPTKYCTRYRANRQELTLTLESFVYRTAS